ncbi:MAG: inositol-3-phosphate synthase, partial [Syntrophorhabdaceae bacterium]|nr:inositol-3-phosphate synthase [Syntrophorhabdaceae bacterium]
MEKIRVAVAGVGNCCSALLQGIKYYSGNAPGSQGEFISGLISRDIGGYFPESIEIVAAFDIDTRKVGRPVNEAIFSAPNCTKQFVENMPSGGPVVLMGPILDGIAPHMADYPDDRTFMPSDEKPRDVEQVLRESGAEMLVNFLPVGSENATRHYAEACLRAGVSIVNCIPVFIASNKDWARRFQNAGIPIIGDDVKSQLGATIIHRELARLFSERGIRLMRTYQLNTGGNTDFLNMLNRSRLESKKISKTEAVTSALLHEVEMSDVHIGPSDYVPWQKDNKICFLRIEGEGFGGLPIEVELRLSVTDSPNSAGVVIDAIRYCRLGRDMGLSGPLNTPSAYFMKHPPTQCSEDSARRDLEEFIADYNVWKRTRAASPTSQRTSPV